MRPCATKTSCSCFTLTTELCSESWRLGVSSNDLLALRLVRWWAWRAESCAAEACVLAGGSSHPFSCALACVGANPAGAGGILQGNKLVTRRAAEHSKRPNPSYEKPRVLIEIDPGTAVLTHRTY